MVYPTDVTNKGIEVKSRLLEKYKTTNFDPARQLLSIEIYRGENGAGINLGKKHFIATILKRLICRMLMMCQLH
jgi:hypothetical protein